MHKVPPVWIKTFAVSFLLIVLIMSLTNKFKVFDDDDVGMVATINGKVITSAEIESINMEARDSNKLAIIIEPEIWKLVSAFFNIPMSNDAIVSYMTKSHPYLLSDAHYKAEHDLNENLLGAFKMMKESGDVEFAYNRFLSEYMSLDQWRNTLQRTNLDKSITNLQDDIRMGDERVKNNLVSGIKSMYVHEIVHEKICETKKY